MVPPGASTSVHVKGDGTVCRHVPVSGQPSTAHVGEQPSSPVVLPSSHTSPSSITPLPHTVVWQWKEQPSPFVVLPSSHCSPGSMMPLPQTFTSHAVEQPSPFVALASSQGSGPSTMPSPQDA